MSSSDIECFRGDTQEWTVTVARDGLAVDLTGATVVMAAKRSYADPVPVFVRTVDDGVTIDPDQVTNTGKVTVKLASTSTSGLAADTAKLKYDIQVTTVDGDTWTVVYGTLTVKPDVSS